MSCTEIVQPGRGLNSGERFRALWPSCFMLNTGENEIYPANKYKMPTRVGLLVYTNRIKINMDYKNQNAGKGWHFSIY